MNPKELFHSKDEELISSLGQGYLSSIAIGDELSKSSLVLSNRRLYQTGKIYEFKANQSAGYSVHKGKKVVSIEDVTGTSYKSIRQPLPLYIGAGIGMPFFFAPYMGSPDHSHSSGSYAPLIGFLIIIVGFIAWFLAKENFFLIEYNGGYIGVPCNWYGTEELEEFQKAISVEKDKLKKR